MSRPSGTSATPGSTTPTGRRLVDLDDHPLHVLGYSEAVVGRLSRGRAAGASSVLDSRAAGPDPGAHLVLGATLGLLPRRSSSARDSRRRRSTTSASTRPTTTTAASPMPRPSFRETTEDEILVSTYTCHPGLANDGVSGMVVAALLVEVPAPRDVAPHGPPAARAGHDRCDRLACRKRGSPTDAPRAGVVVSCLGDRGPLIAKHSRRGDSTIDRAAALVVTEAGGIRATVPRRGAPTNGSSARRDSTFPSSLSRGPRTATSPSITPPQTTSRCSTRRRSPGRSRRSPAIIDVVDRDDRLVNLCRRANRGSASAGSIRRSAAGAAGADEALVPAFLWVLNLSDGRHSLLEIADRSALPFCSPVRGRRDPCSPRACSRSSTRMSAS